MLLCAAADRSYVLPACPKEKRRKKKKNKDMKAKWSGSFKGGLSHLRWRLLRVLLLSRLKVPIVRQTHKSRENRGTFEPGGSQPTPGVVLVRPFGLLDIMLVETVVAILSA